MPEKYEYEDSHLHFNNKVIKYSYGHWAMAKTLFIIIYSTHSMFTNFIILYFLIRKES